MGGGGGGGGCVVKGKRACVRREGAIVGLVVRRLGDAVSELRAKLRPPISPLPHILFSQTRLHLRLIRAAAVRNECCRN